MGENCKVCKSDLANGKNIQCDNCNQWLHKKCTYLKEVQDKFLSKIPYHCDFCAIKMKCVLTENESLKDSIENMSSMMAAMANKITQMNETMGHMNDELNITSAKVNALKSVEWYSWMTTVHQEIKEIKYEITEIKKVEKSDELKSKLEMVTNKLTTVSSNIDEKKEKATYADSLKSAKKMLIVKSTNNEQKAADNKKSIMENITTPVEAVETTKDGHLAIRFANKRNLETVKMKLKEDTDNEISVTEKGKLKPKIKITNVSKDDENVIDSIKTKNDWIAKLIEDDEDLEIKKEEQAKDKKKKHYIIKCSPKIRKAIYQHGDKIHTRYECCNIYDSYQPYQCYKCQGFGHSATNCSNDQVCPKCGENHSQDRCNNQQLNCANCEKRGLQLKNHKTYDRKNCTVYMEEIARIKNNTDHGYDQ